jgi:cytochrome c oxidase subunit 2
MLKNILVLKIFTFITLLSSNTLSKGQPTEWQLSFQEAASPLMQNLIDFHDFVFWVITFITVFVFFLLAYVCFKFSASRNKTPSQTTHNSLLEVAWTVIPVLILVVIAILILKKKNKNNNSMDDNYPMW